jgi:MYXO-CTERM domain-containing protein
MSKADLAFTVFSCCLCSSLVAQAESPIAAANINISNVVIGEGDSGTTPFTAQVSLYGWSSTVTVKISATPGTADETDYVFTPTELTFSAGSPAQTVSGTIVGDTDPEGDEHFTLTATLATGSGYPYVYSSGGSVTITDDDQAHASQLHLEGVSLLEGDQGTTTAQVRVILEPASSNTVTVAYQTEDGTATAGQDYQSASGKLTFAPGELLKTIPITIVGDTVFESDESFAVVLSQPQMALLGTARADVVIANDDAAVHATIADLEVDEGNVGVKSVPITVHFDQPVSGSGKLRIRLVGAGAVADQDFRALADTYYPSAGATQMTFNVEILSDTQSECDEGLFIEYTEVYMGDDATKTAKMVLRNDDEPAQGCGDPFVPPSPAEPARDGGVIPPPVDAEVVKATLDADRSSETGPDTFAGAGSDTGIDRQAAADAGIDTQSTPGDGLIDLPDSGATVPQGPRVAKSSGCSCAMTAPAPDASLLLFAVAGMLAVLVRRSRSR